MTRGVALVLVLAAGMAIAIAGSWGATRPAATAAWLRNNLRRAPSDENMALVAALTAVFGIFVAILAAIAEIWWLQGVRVP
jgi:hypothetical protein